MKKFRNFKEYRKYFSYLIELERKEEMKLQTEEINKISGIEREKRGRALLNLKSIDLGIGIGGRRIVKFVKSTKPYKFPPLEIEPGDLVLLSRKKIFLNSNPNATVLEKTNYSITVAFDKNPPSWIFYSKIRLDLFVNDTTFQRMLKVLKKLWTFKEKKKEFLEKLLLNKNQFLKSKTLKSINFLNKNLNQSQKKAIKKALSSKEVFLIYGPPGTGKTTTCVELIIQFVLNKKKVLACADSNIGVDNILEGLIKYNINVIRVGHPARILPDLRKHSLDFIIENDKEYQKIKHILEKIEILKFEQDGYLKPKKKWRRGLTDEEILLVSKKNRNFRGIPAKKLKSMAKWIEKKRDLDILYKKLRNLEANLIKKNLLKADVICATNSTAYSEILQNIKFDVVIIDEATQSQEPSCLMPITKANKVILIGDHNQLPPTILSKKAEKLGLGISLFERLVPFCKKEFMQILNIQYRMNENLMEFSNKEFYNYEVKASKNVKKITLKDLGIKYSNLKCIDYKFPLVFIDTYKTKTSENIRKGSTSKENLLEAEIVNYILQEFRRLGIKDKDIGIISPYQDQIDLLENLLNWPEELEVKTVDGFQGREKEIIILTLVRSNTKKEIGFLEDKRRLNVALTRAKRKLIIIGDSNTLAINSVFKKLIKFIKNKGLYLKFTNFNDL